MAREVDIIDYLPSYLQEYREIQGIMNAENPEFQLLENTSETVMNNMFAISTNEEGIKRHEKMFGLTASKNDNLQSRQGKVLAQYTNAVNYTFRGLVERLNVICGVDNYTLNLDRNNYELNISLNLRVKSLINTIIAMLADMIPANLICTVTLDYNTHEVLAAYPTYLLKQFTHQELRELVIDDNISATCDNIANYTMEDFEVGIDVGIEQIRCEHILNFGMRKV